MRTTILSRLPAARSASLGAAVALASCAAGHDRVAGESDAACIHRLYDYPQRTLPFASAVAACAGSRPPDLTGDAYFQKLARTDNIPFEARDRDRGIVLTGSRLPQPVDAPADPQLRLR